MTYGKVLWTMYNSPVMEMADSSVLHLIQWNWLRSKPTPQEVLEGCVSKTPSLGWDAFVPNF